MIADVLHKLSPITCTDPGTGNQGQFDNPLGGLPFIGGPPSGCVNGPSQSLPGAIVDGVWGPGTWANGTTDLVKTASTFWLNTPTPTVADDNHVVTGAAAQLQAHLGWLTFVIMTCCIMVKGAHIAWAGSKAGEPLTDLARGVFEYFVAAGIVAGAVQVTLVLTDGMAGWLIDQSTNGAGFETNLNAWLDNPDLLNSVPTVLGIGLGILGFLFSLLQVGFMAFRDGTVPIIVGAYLLTASAATIKQGRVGHRRLTTWLLAFTFYKLAAAIVYSGAFWLMGTPASNANATWTILTGVALQVLAIISIYALIKLFLPGDPDVAGKGYASTVTTAAIVAR